MPCCIEMLESRQLLSVTPMTLAKEVQALNVDASADQIAINVIAQDAASDLNALRADLHGGSSVTQALLLRAVQAAENQYLGKLTSDVNALLSATTLAEQGATDGKKLLKHSPTPKRIARVQADIAAMTAAIPGPLSAIRVDEQSTAVSTALTALTNANSSNKSLAADAAKLNSDNSLIGGTIVGDSQTFAFTVEGIATDLSTLVP